MSYIIKSRTLWKSFFRPYLDNNALQQLSRRINELDKDKTVNIALLRKISKPLIFWKKEKRNGNLRLLSFQEMYTLLEFICEAPPQKRINMIWSIEVYWYLKWDFVQLFHVSQKIFSHWHCALSQRARRTFRTQGMVVENLTYYYVALCNQALQIRWT